MDGAPVRRLLWRLRRRSGSRPGGDPAVRRQHTSETDVGAPSIPCTGRTGRRPAARGCRDPRFMPRHAVAAVLRRLFRWVCISTTGDWGSSSLAFAISVGSNAACHAAPSGSRAFIPACCCPFGLSAAGELVAQGPPSSPSWLRQGCAGAPHGAHGACTFPRTPLSSGRVVKQVGPVHHAHFPALLPSTCAPSPCGRLSRPPRWAVTPTTTTGTP